MSNKRHPFRDNPFLNYYATRALSRRRRYYYFRYIFLSVLFFNVSINYIAGVLLRLTEPIDSLFAFRHDGEFSREPLRDP